MLETPNKLRSRYRDRSRKSQAFASMNVHSTNALKEKLVKEMLELDKQRQQLDIDEGKMDFSMVQTYKEMIQSRRVMLNQLGSSPV